MDICKILGVNIQVASMNETIEYIDKNLDSLSGNYICIANVHTTVMAAEDEKYLMIQNTARLVLPDGGPLSTISRIKGFRDAKRVTGPDLMEEVFKLSSLKGYTHYFYGSTEENLKNLKQQLIQQFPKLKIVGMYSPPFRATLASEDEQIIKQIKFAKADFIWVGLGAPKQEMWMYNHKSLFDGVMVGVGAGFDYFSENIKRAPIWMQNSNLEWLYRLLQEPKRLIKRYLVYNSKFVFKITRELIKDN